MSQALTVMIPLLAFMLVPVWIPLFAIVFGSIADHIRTPQLSPAAQRVEAIRARQGLVHASAEERKAADVVAFTGRAAVLEEDLAEAV